jgi:hypothetical protein
MGGGVDILEQVAGALLIFLVLLDIFLTVLYARIRTGVLSALLARKMWFGFRAIAAKFPDSRGKILSYCGPTILVVAVLMWGFGLTFGSGLILHPHLGTSIRASSGETDTDFITALYAGGSSIAVVGASDYEPRNAWFKMLYLFNSLVGMSVLSLTLTYLMQIYTALKQRNSVALSVEIGTDRTGDAAEFVRGLGPQGHFETGYISLTNLSSSLASLKEAHHFYPVLFYFRFEETYYSVSRLTNVALDAVTIIRTALHPSTYRWMIESGAIADIRETCLLVLTTLEGAFVAKGIAGSATPDPETRERWRQRFFNAVAKLQDANIETVPDLDAAADRYVSLRSKWSAHIQNLAPSMLYSNEEIDPAAAQDQHAEKHSQAA